MFCGASFRLLNTTTSSLEGTWALSTSNFVSLSEQQFVHCDTTDSGCNGGLMDNAFAFAQKKGICKDGSHPHTEKVAHTHRQDHCGSHRGAVGFKDVTTDNEQAAMSALSPQPPPIANEADQSSVQLYKTCALTATGGTMAPLPLVTAPKVARTY